MSAPEGWMLVPIEPTDEMVAAYRGALQGYIESLPEHVRARAGKFGVRVNTWSKACARYRAMISAAPKPPVSA